MTPSWTCQVGAAAENLTVGKEFSLQCQGAEVPGFNAQTMALELPKEKKFNLKILETKAATSTGVDLVVTSYVAGPSDLRDVILTDGTNRIELTGVNYTVQSVLKEDEQPKPFPPEPPVSMMWPTSALILIGAVVLAILLMIGFVIQWRRRRAKFLVWLAAQKTPLSPFDLLNKELRAATKERDPKVQIQTLEVMTRKFLSRLFAAPLMAASTSKVIKVISAGDKKSRAKLEPLTVRLFGEFNRVSESLQRNELNAVEAMNVTLPQVHELVREFGEAIQAERTKKRRAL